jgi:excisionase family DNA binding protein
MELLTVQETAQLLRVAPLTIRRYIQEGRLPGVKVGKAVRVRKEAVERFLKPINRKTRSRASATRRGKATSADDPLWSIVGIGRSGGPGDVSENKRKYLAEAYAAEGR